MAYPDPYSRQYDYQSYQNANPTRPLPADKVNADLNAVAESTDQIVAFLQGFTRDDGALRNGSVNYDTLSPGLQTAGIAPANAWAAGTAYLPDNSVIRGGYLYRCVIAHTSSTFDADLAAGKWTVVTQLFDVPGLIATQAEAEAGVSNVVAMSPLRTRQAFDVFLEDSAPFYAVVNPSSGNLQGSGTPVRHQLVWSDANPVFWADQMCLTSEDPSALAQITIGGSATAGDVVQLTFKWGVHTATASYTVQSGDTTTTIAAGLVAAIQANVNLHNPVSATNTLGGGYANSRPVGYAVNVANVIAFDFHAGIGLSMTKAVSGAATETVTLPATDPTPLPTPLDNNPAFSIGRNPGFAPAANSVLGVLQFVGPQSTNPTQLTVQYGSFFVQVLNSTTGALSSRFGLVTPDVNNVQNQGAYVGAGIYTVGVNDKGVDTINTKQLWISDTEEIVLSGSELSIISGTGHGIQLVAGSGAARIVNAAGDVSLTLAADAATRNIALIFNDGALRWQAYKPASSTDLRFYDGTADRVFFKNGGVVQVATGGLTVGDTGTPASGVISAATGYRIGNAAPTAGHYLRGNGTNFIDGVIDAGDVATGILTVARGGTGLGSGTSGGVLGFTASGTLASSVALAANTLVAGGGAGATPKNSGLTVAGSDLTSLNAASNVTSLPQFVLTNNVNDANPASFLFRKNRANTDTLTNDSFLDMQGYGYASSSLQVSARWQIIQAASSSGANVPTKHVWNTSNASGQLNQTMTFDNTGTLTLAGSAGALAAAGSILSSSATAGFGYATGAGGTVTQLTSKSTGVTLNKVSGAITMHNAALASAAKVPFVVTNSAVAATDTPVVGVASGGTANAYRADVTAVAAGSFTITVENITAGSLSESPVITFEIVKGVTS